MENYTKSSKNPLLAFSKLKVTKQSSVKHKIEDLESRLQHTSVTRQIGSKVVKTSSKDVRKCGLPPPEIKTPSGVKSSVQCEGHTYATEESVHVVSRQNVGICDTEEVLSQNIHHTGLAHAQKYDVHVTVNSKEIFKKTVNFGQTELAPIADVEPELSDEDRELASGEFPRPKCVVRLEGARYTIGKYIETHYRIYCLMKFNWNSDIFAIFWYVFIMLEEKQNCHLKVHFIIFSMVYTM